MKTIRARRVWRFSSVVGLGCLAILITLCASASWAIITIFQDGWRIGGVNKLTLSLVTGGHLSLLIWAIIDWPLQRNRIYRFLGLYEKPPSSRFRLFRSYILVVLPLLLLSIDLFNLDHGMIRFGDQPAGNTLNHLGPAAIVISTVAATSGWLISSYQSQQLHRKQHTLDIALKLLLDHELLDCDSNISAAIAAFRAENPEYSSPQGVPKPLPLACLNSMQVRPDGNDTGKSAVWYILQMLNFYEYVSLGIRSGDLDYNHIRKTMRANFWRDYWLFEELIESWCVPHDVILMGGLMMRRAGSQTLANYLWLINLLALDRDLEPPAGRSLILPPDY